MIVSSASEELKFEFPGEEQTKERPVTRPGSAVAAAFLGLLSIALFFEIFVWPAVPVVRLGASGVNLVNAARMVGGEVMYRDFFQYTPPGTELVYGGLIRLIGQRSWMPNAVTLTVGIFEALLGIVIAARLLSGWSMLLPSAIFGAFGFTSHLYPDHHLFSVAVVFAALTVLIGGRDSRRIAAAGALCGASICFTQIQLMPLLGLTLFLCWEGCHEGYSPRSIALNELLFLLPALAVIIVVNGYFAWATGISRYLEYMIGFPLYYYRADTDLNTWTGVLAALPALRDSSWYTLLRVPVWIALGFLISVFYLGVLIRLRHHHRGECGSRHELILLATVGFSLELAGWYAPTFRSLAPISLPGLVILVRYLDDRQERISGAALRSLWAATIIGVIGGVIVTQSSALRLETNAGPIALSNRDSYEMFKWVSAYVEPGQKFFDADTELELHYYLQAKDPCVLGWVTPNDYTRPEQVNETRACLEAHRVSPILWAGELDGRVPRAADDHLEPLRRYLDANYHIISGRRLWGDSFVLLGRNQR